MFRECVPRLCHLVKWPGCDVFGFTVRTEKWRRGHFVGKVDADSPARQVGLLVGDRIVEINGVNITQESHSGVVERIKSIAGETRLLVVDPETDRFYREQKRVVKSTMPDVLFLETPVPCKETPLAPEERNATKECKEQHIHTFRSSIPLNGGPSSVPDSTKSFSSVGGAINAPLTLEVDMLHLNMGASEMCQMVANRRIQLRRRRWISARSTRLSIRCSNSSTACE